MSQFIFSAQVSVAKLLLLQDCSMLWLLAKSLHLQVTHALAAKLTIKHIFVQMKTSITCPKSKQRY